jgi:hypothetical protein
MPKTRRTRRRHSRRQRGGDSAWQGMMKTVGDGNTQWNNALMLKSDQNIIAQKSNNVVPLDNPNFGTGQVPNVSQMGGVTGTVIGGKRRKSKKGGDALLKVDAGGAVISVLGGGRGRRRPKKGGYWGAVLNQALVPFTLLGLQLSYGNRKTRRRS